MCYDIGVTTSGQLMNVSTSKCFKELVSQKMFTVRTECVDDFGIHFVQLVDEALGQSVNELMRRHLVS